MKGKLQVLICNAVKIYHAIMITLLKQCLYQLSTRRLIYLDGCGSNL